jgi:hypothetical protein
VVALPALTSVSCPTAAFCAAVDDLGEALTFDGSRWSPPAEIDSSPAGGSGGLTSISCPTAKFCQAVDAAGSAVV